MHIKSNIQVVNSLNIYAHYATFGNFQHTSVRVPDGFFSLGNHTARINLVKKTKTSVLDEIVISPLSSPVGMFYLITSAE